MEIGNIQSVDIDHQMRTAYLDYAMSVIVARALPDARDGLKPVHRRILFGMHELGVRANSGFKKSARIVGEVMGKYHPHGDAAIYDAMSRMAQDFSMRYLLVTGQGNFGSVDGDAPAAMRYTEARLSSMAEDLLADIEKDTVDFTDNFDSTLREPSVLPSRLPNLLLNGTAGIAVGMATNIPPHNLREVAAALIHLIENHDVIEDINVEDLIKLIPGPDFPTGGMIVGKEGILQAYSTGRGRLVVQGMAHIEEIKGGRHAIIITEIPFQVNKASLVERIADLAREGKIDSISDMRDESDRRGMSIVIELKRGATPRKVLNQLYKFTALRSTFGVQLLALVDGEPRHLTLKRLLQIFLEHRQEVIIRRSKFELEKARQRAHILEGLLIALANLDDVIQTIRQSPDADTARERLMKRFKLSEIQAQAILDLQLRRLARLERQKIEDEMKEVQGRITFLEDLLNSPRRILEVIRDDLKELSEKYGDERRTRITAEEQEELRDEDLVADEPVLISITQMGYVKRTSANLFSSQTRGRRGVSGQTMREEDVILTIFPARTLHTVLFFSDRGKVYSEKAYQIPDAGRSEKGIPMVNVLSLDAGEKITGAVAVPDFNKAAFCTMATVKGKVKRVALAEFASVRHSGLAAISLEEGDELGWAHLTTGKDEILLVSAEGKALRFSEERIRPTGRQAGGVNGIGLRGKDKVASMEVIEPNGYLLVVSEQGYGKRCRLEEYHPKGRGTGGMTTLDTKSLAKTGKVAVARVVQDEDEVTIISNSGLVLRLKVKEISIAGRATRGVRLMDLTKGSVVASLARISTATLESAIIGAGGEKV
jgi:DNA gyrase subunit A